MVIAVVHWPQLRTPGQFAPRHCGTLHDLQPVACDGHHEIDDFGEILSIRMSSARLAPRRRHKSMASSPKAAEITTLLSGRSELSHRTQAGARHELGRSPGGSVGRCCLRRVTLPELVPASAAWNRHPNRLGLPRFLVSSKSIAHGRTCERLHARPSRAAQFRSARDQTPLRQRTRGPASFCAPLI